MTDHEVADTLNGHDIANWLRKNPNFLQQYPDLALSLVVPKAEGQASSLASYQLEILRDKNRDLNRRLNELYGVAQANEGLTMAMHQMTLALVRQNNVADTWRALVAAIQEDFKADVIRIVTFRPIDDLDEGEWHRVIDRDDASLNPFRDMFTTQEPICGRLNPDKQSLLYGAYEDQVQSSALLPVPEHGMIAIGSYDANRFWPGMGTMFLEMLSRTVPAVLSRYDA